MICREKSLTKLTKLPEFTGTPTVDMKGLLFLSTCVRFAKMKDGIFFLKLILRNKSHCTLVVLERSLTLNEHVFKILYIIHSMNDLKEK
jgi:hypothetical protein